MPRSFDISSFRNVGQLLTNAASLYTKQVAVAETSGRDQQKKYKYKTVTFSDLDNQSSAVASGLSQMGLKPGSRVCLMVPPGVEFISLVFAAFKARLVAILIDPGMGKSNLIQCLKATEPVGFITIPKGHIARLLYRRKFPKAKQNVVVGPFFPFCKTLHSLKMTNPSSLNTSEYSTDDEAAIIFTTGSTGPPKGVLYRHSNFLHQAKEIIEYFSIRPGGVDISAFPLFALFNVATGCTTVFPEMDFTKPAEINPLNLIDAANDWKANQSFGSPALWNTVSRYCEKEKVVINSLNTVLSAGAPVPPNTLRRVKKMTAANSVFYTPYGSTESLPIACADSEMILGETAELSEKGRGTCVGKRFPLIDWRIIKIDDGALTSMEQTTELAQGEIGELLVTGPVVTQEYVTRTDQNRLHKVADGKKIWHRLGDVGYLDEQDRFWFCGRKNHRVVTANGTLFTVPCEAIFNNHELVYRSALVGIGRGEFKRPVIVVEPWPDKFDFTENAKLLLHDQLRLLARQSPLTDAIVEFVVKRQLPTDIRHNSKIFREKIAKELQSTE